jgi:hydrogenase expression/formation protein HypC
MCIGIPVQVIEKGEFMSLCKGRNGEEQVNMMLIGSQPVGTWVVNFLGSAREIISEEEAITLNKALDGMSEIMAGNKIDVDHYFPEREISNSGEA